MLEKIIRAAELNREGTIFNKSVQLLEYADDIYNRALNSAFSRLNKEAKDMGLVDEMPSNNESLHSRIGSHVTVDSLNLKVTDNFLYLGTGINTNNNVNVEIQPRIGGCRGRGRPPLHQVEKNLAMWYFQLAAKNEKKAAVYAVI